MAQVRHRGWALILSGVALAFAVVAAMSPAILAAGPASPVGELTFTRDIAPILQRSCQNCHRPEGVAPMPLSDDEIAKIAKWADSGAPQGNPADLPPPIAWPSGVAWTIGEPDLIFETDEVLVTATQPDWWGEFNKPIPTGLTEDRYVAAVEIKEINDVKGETGRATVGGRFVFHHMTYRVGIPGEPFNRNAGAGIFPPHEVGRNADIFADDAGQLMKAGSSVIVTNVHLHSNGRETKARLRFGFKLHPQGYQPKLRKLSPSRSLGNGMDFDIRGMERGQLLHSYSVLQDHTQIVSFEPHLHAPGVRMCLEYIWGMNIQTLSCSGYDHNWVRVYEYQQDYQPLLPKGTILHLIGYMDLSPANKNVADPRKLAGRGQPLGGQHVH